MRRRRIRRRRESGRRPGPVPAAAGGAPSGPRPRRRLRGERPAERPAGGRRGRRPFRRVGAGGDPAGGEGRRRRSFRTAIAIPIRGLRATRPSPRPQTGCGAAWDAQTALLPGRRGWEAGLGGGRGRLCWTLQVRPAPSTAAARPPTPVRPTLVSGPPRPQPGRGPVLLASAAVGGKAGEGALPRRGNTTTSRRGGRCRRTKGATASRSARRPQVEAPWRSPAAARRRGRASASPPSSRARAGGRPLRQGRGRRLLR